MGTRGRVVEELAFGTKNGKEKRASYITADRRCQARRIPRSVPGRVSHVLVPGGSLDCDSNCSRQAPARSLPEGLKPEDPITPVRGFQAQTGCAHRWTPTVGHRSNITAQSAAVSAGICRACLDLGSGSLAGPGGGRGHPLHGTQCQTDNTPRQLAECHPEEWWVLPARPQTLVLQVVTAF